MTPTLRLDADDPTPPYEQLRRQFVDLIGSGVLPLGERLPPLRQLAGDLGLAVGTVARAYRELEAAGLVRSRRGGGTRVTRDVPPPEGGPALDRHAAAYARQASLLGADLEAAVTALRRSWPAG
ncbi:GntR family transcriptional regulator [Micromonospora siamensis]|uniref:Regulatory protein, gntR family n=1 Tax=Micromonospora siamensis TaxID=299152 RepID=A0A1C5HIU1_9ACTN|nr:GntR family transcriptional regulator [Micromonospora siamensis]SCG45441.1 regulatory protein, gntR family [Micromonospora siamensis]